jgi:K+-transporting ATPase ATPase A chain
LANVPLDLAFNASVSILTNTGWQSRAPEAFLSPLSQMAGFTAQNFFSAATGMAVMVALVRGFTRSGSADLGNFWADLVRGILYILLPLALILTFLLVSQGVVQTLDVSVDASWYDASVKDSPRQPIALGPAASLVAVKQLSSNGAGFFNANSAHPFENPTPLSNFLELLAILLIPAAQFFMFGHMAGDKRQGWSLLIAMSLVFVPMLLFGIALEQNGNPLLSPLGIDQTAHSAMAGSNMEGKESRIGVVGSVLWMGATTATSNGSVNASLDSFMPLAGSVPLMLMQFDEAIFGGVGSGLYSMLIFVVITVFIAGLMGGRSPEYLGNKIQIREIKMGTLAMLMPHMVSLLGAALALTLAAGKAGAFNPGAQGFSEILYAFTSAANTNGSGMAGLSSNTPFYNIGLGITMLAGRFLVILPVLAMAGSLAEKKIVPPARETLSTVTPVFVLFLTVNVVIVGVLTILPTLALGPIAEHFNLLALHSSP